jgi:hypothetical protein
MCFGMYNLNLKLRKNIQEMCRRFKMSFLNELGNINYYICTEFSSSDGQGI